MEKCAAELVALIVEYACAADLGKTARILKLVSKRLYSFAGPLEFRALAIIGMDQLKATISRLEKAKETGLLQSGLYGKANVNVQHLFICEYTLKDITGNPLDAALFRFSITTNERIALMADDERRKEYRHEFWNLITTLVSSVSTTLKTLTMLQHWSPDLREHSCCVLSGLNLPRLEVLTLRQSSNEDARYQAFGSDKFIPPEAPSLQRLQINALLYNKDTKEPFFHPLLEDVHLRFGKLSHLVICGPSMRTFEALSSVLDGWADEAVLACAANRRLPGNLVSATVRRRLALDLSTHGYFIFHFNLMETQDDMKKTARSFVDAMKSLVTEGLTTFFISIVHPPSAEYVEEGEWSFKAPFAEWKMGALED